jgi:hypothetical protein
MLEGASASSVPNGAFRAVRGQPDDQELLDESEAYRDLADAAKPLPMRPCRDQKDGWLFALDGKHWFGCRMCRTQKRWITKATEPIRGGMSGFADAQASLSVGA